MATMWLLWSTTSGPTGRGGAVCDVASAASDRVRAKTMIVALSIMLRSHFRNFSICLPNHYRGSGAVGLARWASSAGDSSSLSLAGCGEAAYIVGGPAAASAVGIEEIKLLTQDVGIVAHANRHHVGVGLAVELINLNRRRPVQSVRRFGIGE